MVVTSSLPRRRPDHVVVMGAGPAGLWAALELVEDGTAVTLLEANHGSLGGVAGTTEFLGCRFDRDPRVFRPEDGAVSARWNDLLGEEMLALAPLGRIYHQGKYFTNPINPAEACLKLGAVEAARCLVSYAQARLGQASQPHSLEDLQSNAVGQRLFSILGKTYLEKVWGRPMATLSPDWAVRGITAFQTGLAAPQTDALYPRLGAGQLWEAVAGRLRQAGHTVWMGQEVIAVRHASGRVIGVTVRDGAGRTIEVAGSDFISTMPVRELVRKLWPAVPAVVRRAAEALEYRDLITVNVVLDRAEVFRDHSVAVHDPSVRMARVANWKNFTPEMVADPELTGLGIGYFCRDTDDLWALSDADLLDLGRRELVAVGLCEAEEVKAGIVSRAPKAYAVSNHPEPEPLALVSEWLGRALPNLRLVEREGIECHDQVYDPTRQGTRLAQSVAAVSEELASWQATALSRAMLG